MSRPHIALNRFGYGLRLGGHTPSAAPGGASRYLLAQMEAFDPAPALISAREDTSEKAGEILDMLRQLRRMRRNQSSAGGGMMDAANEAPRPSNAEMMNALPPELRASYRSAGQTLRHDAGLKAKIAAASPTPMMERLVHFWANHFSVSAGKPGTHYQVANHEFAAIRPHVLGNFADMLRAAVLHPAMLLYLDQFRSVGPNSEFEQRRARRRGSDGRPSRGLNENLAREIMELHTLGVDGGYSQTDVTEFAGALTGWTIQGLRQARRFSVPRAGGAAFVERAHEPGTRRVLGRSYSQTGPDQAEAILSDLATHPATARFVSEKLARHFAGDVPPPTLIRALEADFLRTGGDLASLTRTLVAAPEVWEESPVKFRAPFEWLVAVLRLTGRDDQEERRIARWLREIGQMPWSAPSPAGFDDLQGSWAGPDALLRRVELAERMARGAPSDGILDHAEMAFPGALSDHTRTWLSRAESGSQALGLLLVSPEMMRR